MPEQILVVDDEEMNRELMEATLAHEGYQVALASDGWTALAQATASPPDVILLDLLLPGMHGIEVCQRLKQHPALAPVPIIIVTAVGQTLPKEAALASGADDFVTKPIDLIDLRTRIAAILRVRHVNGELARTLAYLHELETARHAQRRAALARMAAGIPLALETPHASDPARGRSAGREVS